MNLWKLYHSVQIAASGGGARPGDALKLAVTFGLLLFSGASVQGSASGRVVASGPGAEIADLWDNPTFAEGQVLQPRAWCGDPDDL